MAELAAVVGLTASIVQLLDACKKVADRIREFQHNRAFAHLNTKLNLTLNRIKEAQEQHPFDRKTQEALLGAGNECQGLTTQLDTLIARMSPAEKDSKLRSPYSWVDASFTKADPDSAGPNVVVLVGMGGQGKTQLALKYCRKHRPRYQAVLWVDASSAEAAAGSFDKIATIFEARGFVDRASSKKSFVIDHFNGMEMPWMLIFDNYLVVII